MPSREEVQHDLLLIIAISIAILFATGLAGPSTVTTEPVVFP